MAAKAPQGPPAKDSLTSRAQPPLMIIEKRTMGWFPKPSAWDYQQSLNAKRRAQAQAYISTQSAVSTAIFSVQDSFSQAMTQQTLQSTLSRVQNTAQQKLANASAASNPLDVTV